MDQHFSDFSSKKSNQNVSIEFGARAAIPRFFYNAERGECENFIYGGCNGNENNFERAEDCEAMCRFAELNDL